MKAPSLLLGLALLACRASEPSGAAPVEVQREPARDRAPQAAAPAPAAPAPAAPDPGSAPAAAAATAPEAAPATAPAESPTAAASAPPAKSPTAAPATAVAPSAAAPATAAATRSGTVVQDEAFSTWLEVKSPVAVGANAEIEAVLVAKPPYHCNQEYPHKFKFKAAPAGLAYPEAVVRGMKVTPERGVLRLPVVAKNAGAATASGTLSFSVCTDERCLVEKRDLEVAFDVR